MKIDVAVMTYNSAKYLEESLVSLEKAIPINRLIVVDHHSKDGTVEIAERHNAQIYQEDVGLGYARQLAISKIETPIFYFHDSDVIYYSPFGWVKEAINKLLENEQLASVVAKVSHADYPSPRAKYIRFWWKHVPTLQTRGFACGSAFIKLDSVKDVKIPKWLDAREDGFLELHILHKKLKVHYIKVNGVHLFVYSEKGSWAGANERLLTGLTTLPFTLVRRILTAPFKAIPPMFVYKDPSILFWNTKHWWNYLRGFLMPHKYRKLKREMEDKEARIRIHV